MAKSLREIVESVVFAGLKPGGQPAETPGRNWLGPFKDFIDRLLSSGPAPADPLYLSHRTTAQKVRLAVFIAIPCLILATGTVLMLTDFFGKRLAPPAPEITRAEIAAKMLRNMDQVKVVTNHDIEVINVRVERGEGSTLSGTIKNNTSHVIRAANIVFDLTDSGGSQLGAVRARVENLPAQSSTGFRVPIEQQTAIAAWVRDTSIE